MDKGELYSKLELVVLQMKNLFHHIRAANREIDEIKEAENRKIQEMQQKYEQEMKAVHKELEPLLALKKTLEEQGLLKTS